MDVMLHNHKAKHVCDVPDGLRELCADISREVIRSQPLYIYDFIENYLNTLMVTRENAKVAMKVVHNIMLKSEQIVEILSGTGLKLEEIAAAAPRLQKAFRAYLDAVDGQRMECGCDDDSDIDDESEISICRILKETGATYEEARCAAIKIQALFRGHYERMSLAEKGGKVQWQRAAVNTMEILRKSGVSRSEASHAAVTIQAAYRGYYTRKNLDMDKYLQQKEGHMDFNEKINMFAWLDMMFEKYGLTIERANEAAIIIQSAYRSYRERKYPRSEFLSLSKISNSIEREVATSAAEESDRNQEKIGQIDSSDDDDSEIGLRAVKFHSTTSRHSDDMSTEIREASFENDDQAMPLIEAAEEEEHQNDDEKEVKDDVTLSDSAGKIRFADLDEHEDENHTNVDDLVEDEIENEETKT